MNKSKKRNINYSLLNKSIHYLEDEITSVLSRPVSDYPFTLRVDDRNNTFTKEKAVIFHHTLAQLLFIGTQLYRRHSNGVSIPH